MMKKSSFDYMWDLLNPPREFHNMRSKCETALWNTLSIHMQHRVYRLIRDRKRRGESVNPQKISFLEKFPPEEEHIVHF